MRLDIRCIKPNSQKKPLNFNKELVLQQLRCGGVLEQLRISRAGYPSRLPYANVMRRYVKLVIIIFLIFILIFIKHLKVYI